MGELSACPLRDKRREESKRSRLRLNIQDQLRETDDLGVCRIERAREKGEQESSACELRKSILNKQNVLLDLQAAVTRLRAATVLARWHGTANTTALLERSRG